VSAAQVENIVGAGPLLLDFDGPVCSIFAGLRASDVAAELVNVLRGNGVKLPDAVATEPDPLAVLRWTGDNCGPALTTAVEDLLCALELRAIGSASPTPSGREVILAARGAGLPVAVVSNNSAGAVAAYLSTYGLAKYVGVIVGRPYARPERMKPHPAPILEAVRALAAEPPACVLIGDSLTDVKAARAAGVRVIGFANRQHKVKALESADFVITSMSIVAETLTPLGTPSTRPFDQLAPAQDNIQARFPSDRSAN
jgi:HAD superfamily hydrolase (TIGR01509 family)